MTGDLEREPVEGVDALDDLANAIDPVAEGDKDEKDVPSSEDSDEEEQEEQETEDEEEEDEEEATFTIKHDGKEVTLTESELIELGQKGFDYSKKTMEVAEERKAVEVQRSQAEHYRKQNETALSETVGRLQAFTQFMEEQLGSPPPIEWAEQNASYYLAQKELYESRKDTFHKAQAAIQSLQNQQSRQRQDWIVQQADVTEAALRSTLPGWTEKTLDELAEYARGYGLTPETVDIGLLQKGFWELAHKAKAYDAIQAKKAEMKPKESLARVVKPNAQNKSAKASERAKREAAFNSNPSVDALANLLR